jgi:hypothetical protein
VFWTKKGFMVFVRILQIVFGLAMLLLGRKLFWIFVGSMGFITATELAVTSMSAQPEWVVVLIGLAAGIVGALLAIFFQAGAIALAGILGGGYLGLLVTRSLQLSSQTAHTIAYVVGAVVGLILFLVFFDGALIAFSSFAGSYILAQQFELTGVYFWLVLVVIAFLGVAFQLKQMGDGRTVSSSASA